MLISESKAADEALPIRRSHPRIYERENTKRALGFLVLAVKRKQ